MDGRMYGAKVDLNPMNVKTFYNKRANMFLQGKKSRNTTVLLGDNNAGYADKWDIDEKSFVLPQLNVNSQSHVLDIGCGVGRWGETLIPLCGEYVGVDFSQEMVRAARGKFNSSGNAKFLCSSFQELFTLEEFSGQKFDVVVITGVSMYINDFEIQTCFRDLASLLNPGAVVYLEESVGVKERLTLNNIWSESLADNYNAIYRTRQEYLELLHPLISACEIKREDYFSSLDKEDFAETSHWYILLCKE